MQQLVFLTLNCMLVFFYPDVYTNQLVKTIQQQEVRDTLQLPLGTPNDVGYDPD